MKKLESLSCTGPVAEKRRAFTLIELLTVVAIIGLLISILLPSLGRARDAAKNVKTKAIMKTIGEGLEAFVNENEADLRGNAYPTSKLGDDPTESGNKTGIESDLFGAQWLVRYLMGKNLDGYVAPRSVPKKYWGDPNSGWWQKGWYAKPGDPDFPTGANEAFARSGPYLQPDAVKLKLPKELSGSRVGLSDTTPRYNNALIVDPYDMPILYYAANSAHAASSNPNIVTEEGCAYTGIYNFGDNLLFTGGCVGTACVPPWDFGNGIAKKLEYPIAWRANPPDWRTAVPEHPDSFAYYIMNKSVFESTGQKTVVPYRKDSFLLISPGKDGLFGTKDDVTNFE